MFSRSSFKPGVYLFRILPIILITGNLSVRAQTGKLSRLMKRENFDAAIKYANEKIAELEKKPNTVSKIEAIHYSLGKIYYKTGEHTEAEREYNSALNLALSKKAAGIRLKLPDFDVMDDLSLFYVNKGNFREARSLIDSSLKWRIHKLTKNDPTNFRPYLPLGLLYYFQGKEDSAVFYLTLYEKNIRNSNYTGFLDINRYADTYQVLSEIEMDEGNLHRARRFSKKAVRLQHHRWTRKESGKNYLARITAMNTLSRIYRLDSNYRRAWHFNLKAMRMQNKNYDSMHFYLVPLYINKAYIDYNLDRMDSSKTDLIRAMHVQQYFTRNNFSYLSEYEKENIYKSLKSNINEIQALVIRMLIDKRIPPNDPLLQRSLDHDIRTRALALSETNKIMAGIAAGENPGLKELYDRWRKLKNEWAYLSNSRFRSIRATAGLAEAEIVKIEKQMSAMVNTGDSGSTQYSDWKRIQNHLKSGEAGIDMIRIDMGGNIRDSSVIYAGYIIKPGTGYPEIVIIKNGYDLEHKLISNYFNSVRYDLDDTLSYRYFWQPFDSYLKAVNRVFISPDGIYNLINFNILKDHDNYLTDRLEIINLTKPDKVIGRSDTVDSTIQSAALIGFPDFSETDSVLIRQTGLAGLAPLPGTEKEINTISDLLKKNGVSVSTYTRQYATENAVKKLASSDILHFATHGYFDNRSASTNSMLNSGLILSVHNDPEDDGLLTAYEASTLNLESTKLVVLSACKTGLGTIREGEGVFGLQRAFEAAGVKNIIISLWDINDEAARQFMSIFYTDLMKPENVASAFHSAMLQMRELFPEPEFWGAFKLITSY